jgi:hypothetical protein
MEKFLVERRAQRLVARGGHTATRDLEQTYEIQFSRQSHHSIFHD